MTSEPAPSGSQRAGSKRPVRWRRRGILLLLAILLLAWCAPWIVSRTPLKTLVVERLARDLAADVTLQSAELSWFSPVVARGVVVREGNQQPLLEVPRLHSEQPLWSILMAPTQSGRYVLEQPVLRVQFDAEGSNIQRVVRAYLESDEPPSPKDLSVQLVDATVHVSDQISGQNYTAEQLRLLFGMSSTATHPWTVQCQTSVRWGDAPPAKLVAQYNHAAAGGDCALKLQTDQLPVQILQPLGRRWYTNLRSVGRLTADVEAQWNWQASQGSLRLARCDLRDFVLTNPDWLGDDRLQSQHVTLTGNVTSAADAWHLEQLRLVSDYGHLEVNGFVQPSEVQQVGWPAALLRLAGSQRFTAQGRLHLAAVARSLPTTLRLRKDVEIQAGDLVVTADWYVEQAQRRCRVELQGTDLAATAGGQWIEWQQPITVRLLASHAQRGLEFDELACRTSFLTLEGSASYQQGHLQGSGDLDVARQELAQFIDLDDVQLSGKLELLADWQQSADNQLQCDGQLTLRDLQVVLPGRRAWQETLLTTTFQAAGARDHRRLARLDQAELSLQSAGDQLQVSLLEPVSQPGRESRWPLRVEASGKFATWMDRLASWWSPSAIKLQGDFQFAAQGTVSSRAAVIDEAYLTSEPFDLESPQLVVHEPAIELEGSGRWDRDSGVYELQNAVLRSSTVAARANQLKIMARRQDPWQRLEGDLVYRCDLARLTAWLPSSRRPENVQLYGQATGRCEWIHSGSQSDLDWTCQIDQFAVARRARRGPGASVVADDSWQTIWIEPTLNSEARIVRLWDSDRWNIQSLQLAASDWLRAKAQGTVSDFNGRCDVQMQGNLQYDWAHLSDDQTTHPLKLPAAWRQQFALSGTQQQPFALSGPLFTATSTGDQRQLSLRELTGSATAGWDFGQVLGTRIGPGKLTARLAEGELLIDPLDLQLAEGRLQLAPRVVLSDPQQPLLLLPPGPLLTNVRITPEMCQSWLKYVAPLLANATRAEGTFSVNLQEARIPLRTPRVASAAGTMTIHTARVGPSPLSQELLWIAQQVNALAKGQPLDALGSLPNTWLQVPQQNVEVALRDGRVQHRQLQVDVGDVSIRTRGSVGLDQSLELVADVPIREAWIARNPLLSSLRGQSIQVPIRGTLTQPDLDRRVLQQLAGQLLQGAAGQLLEQELQQGLRRLFGDPGNPKQDPPP